MDSYKDKVDEDISLPERKNDVSPQELDDEAIEQQVIDVFDNILPRLYQSYNEANLESFSDDAMIIFLQLSGKYPTLFKHAIECDFVSFLLSSFLSEQTPATPTILNLIVGVCNCPSPTVSQYLCDHEEFLPKLFEYIANPDSEISLLALTIFGSILYDLKKVAIDKSVLPPLPDLSSIFGLISQDPSNTDLVFRVIAYLLDEYDDIEDKVNIIHETIPFMRPETKFGLLFDAFSSILKQYPDVAPAFDFQNFLDTTLPSIAVPFRDPIENDIYEWDVKQSNACHALKLIISLAKANMTIANKTLNELNWDELVRTTGKNDDIISYTYQLISLAIPNRQWMFRLLIDTRVMFSLLDILNRAVYDLKFSAITLLNTLFKYSPSSMYADLFYELFTQSFLEVLIDFFQYGQFDLTKEVIVAMNNMIVVAQKLDRMDLFKELNWPEVEEVFDDIENNEMIPPEQKPLESIAHIRETIESIQQEQNEE